MLKCKLKCLLSFYKSVCRLFDRHLSSIVIIIIIESSINTCGMPKEQLAASLFVFKFQFIVIVNMNSVMLLSKDLQTFQYSILFNYQLQRMDGMSLISMLNSCYFLLVKAKNFNFMIDFCAFVFMFFLCAMTNCGINDEILLSLQSILAMHECINNKVAAWLKLKAIN